MIGTGASTLPVAPRLGKYLNSLGIQVDAQDTVCNAALLAPIQKQY
jgi:hypothetical protein